MASGREGSEKKIRALHLSMRMFRNAAESICTVGLCATSKSNMELYCFLIFASYCFAMSKGIDISAIRQVLFVRRSFVLYLITMEDIGK